jgi:hypothetical protein
VCVCSDALVHLANSAVLGCSVALALWSWSALSTFAAATWEARRGALYVPWRSIVLTAPSAIVFVGVAGVLLHGAGAAEILGIHGVAFQAPWPLWIFVAWLVLEPIASWNTLRQSRTPLALQAQARGVPQRVRTRWSALLESLLRVVADDVVAERQ